jgi:zinc protease
MTEWPAAWRSLAGRYRVYDNLDVHPAQFRSFLLSLVIVLIATAAAMAQSASDVTEATLGNGLRVLVLEDHRSPVASIQVWYRVGSRNERPGATGLAHFLEHMMFKGTPKHGKGEFARLVEQNGGQDNAFTTPDETSYFVDIASEKIAMVLELEADRMRNLLLDAKEIDSERQVVMEERRTRTEDDPDGLLSQEMNSLAFKAHQYRWPVIGWMEDIKQIAPLELRAFYNTYYQPNNAVLVVVGDVKVQEVLALVGRLFGSIPHGQEPPATTAVEPPQVDDRRVVIKRVDTQLPIISVAWHVPNHRSADAPALELLSTILSEGRASRLYRKLVYEQRLALGAGGDYSYFSRDPNLFSFSATALPGQKPQVLEEALLSEIELLKKELVPDEELQRAKNQIEAAFVWRQDSVHSRASSLARFELLGSWKLQQEFVPRILAVTAVDLQRVARSYFPTDRKNVGVLLPAEQAKPAAQ